MSNFVTRFKLIFRPCFFMLIYIKYMGDIQE
nr:MAG TPA: hypothetical protein [Caudoviricetes sp.]